MRNPMRLLRLRSVVRIRGASDERYIGNGFGLARTPLTL